MRITLTSKKLKKPNTMKLNLKLTVTTLAQAAQIEALALQWKTPFKCVQDISGERKTREPKTNKKTTKGN